MVRFEMLGVFSFAESRGPGAVAALYYTDKQGRLVLKNISTFYLLDSKNWPELAGCAGLRPQYAKRA